MLLYDTCIKMSARVLTGPNPKFFFKEKTAGDFFFNCGEKYGDRICQIDGTIDKSETFSSVKLKSVRVALALQSRGVTTSDVITFCSPNILDLTPAVLAACYLGAKVTNLEPNPTVRNTKHLLELVTPKIIFVEKNAVEVIEDSLIGTTFQTEIIVFGDSEKHANFETLLVKDKNENNFRPVDVDPKDIALMFFSSGTTGLPKAIVHSHRSLLLAAAYCHQYGFMGTIFHLTSLYWMTAIVSLLCCYNNGTPRVFSRNFSAESTFRIIEKYKVETTFMAPTLAYSLTNFPEADKYNTSSLKMVMCAGSPMAVSQLQKLKKLFKTAFVSMGYGMSEICAVAAFDPEVDVELAEKKLASSGRPAPNLQLKVVNPDTNELLGSNQKGEFRIKSPSLMKGYYRGDTSKVFDKDGFLKTGDIGYYDEDDCVYVVERLKEMFKYKSWHIIPSSVEAVLLEHPSIQEAVVFGIPNEEDGDVPAACVVLKEGTALSESEINKFLEKKVPDREKLRAGVTFMSSLPKTSTGKIQRKEIRNIIINSTR